MKTSVVLLALATAALAAPALHEENFEDVQHIPAKFLEAFTRERKSALESSSTSGPGTPVNLPGSQISEFGVSGRSFNLKKPIIIKKKVGSSYQVYRDSDEEKLDSPEPCRKQVSVKLCDEHNVAKSAAMIEDPNIHTTEDDMKHSIMLAKEAVEKVQKDMKKIEHKPTKQAACKHVDSESDAELHQDIEVARQALEHIHSNFGLEDPLNLQDATLKDAEVVEDVHFPLAQNEEERLAQWKDAIENIQRNVELVRNIEESFKSSPDSMPHTDEVSITKDIHKHEKSDKRVTENEEKKEHKTIKDDLKHSKHEKSSEHSEMKTDLAEKDMMESASMVSTSKLQHLNHHDKARLTSDSLVKSEHITNAKDALEKIHDDKLAVDTTLDHLPQNIDPMVLKDAEETKETDTEKTEKFEKLFDQHDKHTAETKAKMIEMKSAEHITNKHSELLKDEDKTHDEHHTMEQLKQANGFTTEDMTEMKAHENMMHKDHSFVEGKAALNEKLMVPASNSLTIDQHKTAMGHTFDMKSAENNNEQHELIDHSHMRWAQDKQFNAEMGLMKSVAEPQAMDHTKHMHTVHHHAHQQAGPHHLDASSHAHLRQHDHFMNHGKSADMDNAMQSNYYMNMRGSDNMGQESRFKWRPTPTHQHESARSAYGIPATAIAPASGAVGLFPNANVGSCGIPLLLSCNPSVVSGSLAKAHPAPYSAPSYRSEDDFNFHSKRDVKKTENLVNTLNRASTSSILKTNPVLVAKH